MSGDLLFQIVQLLILLVVFIFLIRFLWGTFFDSDYQPKSWKKALNDKLLSKEIIKAEKNYPDKVRFFNFWFQAERINSSDIPGAFAELGVYKGKTARILHLLAPGRTLHLFDTFSGLPQKDLDKEVGEAATYTTERFSDTRLKKVIDYIDGDDKVKAHPGYFPETTYGLEDETFALVSLDADLYRPTIEGLRFFYPRLSPGGCIIIHDYNHLWEGLQKAVNEFVITIPESLVQIPDVDSTVMIIKNK